ncbi:diguanylate cyclase (GGDEF) domain-containing protein [Rheinheimera sp. A13L]|uniref:diguanylate cyclase n=1 Tax=Rheinheimera sp. A13L TaxID=506534 RepID=UPI0002124A5E|nr:diguanylate cyclase [Rheinheimera sp. A13L]EGM77652.1 diguanylate cyclase (GGDEF) domain-containing protein [Rheinheimera sp. A13L]
MSALGFKGAGAILLLCLWLVNAAAWAKPLLSDAQTQHLKQKGKITYCIDPDWLPFEALSAQGKHTGMSAEYIRLLQQMLPVPLELHPTPNWPASLQAAKDRHCDLLTLAMPTPSRLEYLNFSKAYLDVPNVVVTTKDKAFIRAVADIPDSAPIGIRAGFGTLELYQQRYPQLQLVPFHSYEQGLLQVQAGNLYGMLGNMGSISFSLQQNAITNLKIAGRLAEDTLLSLACRNDDPVLLEIFDTLLAQISPEQKQQINNHWLAIRYDQGFDYELFWQMLLAFVLLISIVSISYLKLKKLNQALIEANIRLEQLSQHDPLTGLYNRQYFEPRVQQALALCQRQQLPLTLAMMDLDHFKQINDNLGHNFGDQCLKDFATLCQSQFQRKDDLLVRYGGEEFILVSVGCDAETMQELLQDFLQRLEAHQVQLNKQQGHCTVSIGWYCDIPPSDMDSEALVELADQALYLAKDAGRNCLVRSKAVASSSPDY